MTASSGTPTEEPAPTTGELGGSTGVEIGSTGSDSTGSSSGALINESSGSSSDTGGEDCAVAEVDAQAIPPPVDIIVAIDNSGSMGDEIEAVKAGLNEFSQQIASAGLDHRVVLVSASATKVGQYGICVGPPLGTGMCPGDSTERLLHIDEPVWSTDSLLKILGTYDQWQFFLRSEAPKHVLVVTDDESSMLADDFDEQFEALAPDYRFHALASPSKVSCPLEAASGLQYIKLTQMTGGIFGNVCASDFSPVLAAIADNVIQQKQTPCEFEIPQQDDVDYDEVNVEISDAQNNKALLYRVNGWAECAVAKDLGWYYDDNAMPTKIQLCSKACEIAQGYQITVRFGCKSIYPG